MWSLSIKWANIYQIIGNQYFLLEYAEAGTWLILGILMCVMFVMAQKRYRITNEFIVQIALFFAILTPYFLPHMHERYGCLADVLAILYAMMNWKRFYIPLVQILMSFTCYMAYLSHLGDQEPTIYYGVWALAELALLVIVGLDMWRYMRSQENQLPVREAVTENAVSRTGDVRKEGKRRNG